jgi:hypothetical protein
MMRIILSKIMLMAVAASLAVLSGCDEKKNNNIGMLFALLAGAGQPAPPLTVKSVSPASGSNGLINSFNIIITFNRPTDGTLGTVTLTYDYGLGTNTLMYPNHANDVLSFNTRKNILTIDGFWDFLPGAPYFDIIVSGFRDANGNVMDDYEDASYNFLTWTTLSGKGGVTPLDNLTNVPLESNITISFFGELDTGVMGTVSLDYGSNTISYVNSVNCTMSITNGVMGGNVTVNPTTDFLNFTEYSNIVISGFKDPYGNTVRAESYSDYNFTTADIN